MMHFGIQFKLFLFHFCHIHESYCYVVFLLELLDPQENIVVFLFMERKYLFLFIGIGTAELLLNEHA